MAGSGFLKQSTSATVLIGPFLDDADGKTAETALTISQADVLLSKNGGALAQKNDTNSATHDASGYYACALNSTDTGTLGRLRLCVSESGALPVWHTFTILPANVYDSIIGGSDNLQVDTVQVTGTAQTAGDLAALITAVDDYVDSEVGAIKAVTDKLDTALENDGGVYRYTTNALEQAPSGSGSGDWTADEKTAIKTILGVPASGTTPDVPSAGALKVIDDFLDTEIAAIQTTLGSAGAGLTAIPWNAAWDAEVQSEVQDVVGAAGASLTAIPWNASWDTEVQSEVQDAIEANHLDHLLAQTYDPASKPGAADALLNELIGNDAGVSQFTANALELGPSAASVTCTELTTTPAASPTLAQAVAFLYMLERNKLTVSSTQRKLHNDAGTVVSQQALSDNGTTFERGEFANP